MMCSLLRNPLHRLWVTCTFQSQFHLPHIIRRRRPSPFPSTFRPLTRLQATTNLEVLQVVDSQRLQEMNRDNARVVETGANYVVVRMEHEQALPIRLDMDCSFELVGKQRFDRSVSCMIDCSCLLGSLRGGKQRAFLPFPRFPFLLPTKQ